jgi:hypothetical protein
MKSIKLSDYFRIVKPQYVYLRLKPNNSIRNNTTHKIAKSISSLYRNIIDNIRIEEQKLIKVFGKEFMFGTKYRFEVNSKVSYYVYIEKKRVEFYFIVPIQYLSVIKEKISDSWSGITIEESKTLPSFSEDAAKYQMVYKKEDGLSLSTDRRNNDLLHSNLNIIDVLEENDRVGIFYNFIPTSQFSWPSIYKSTLSKRKNGVPVDRDKFGMTYAIKWMVGQIHSIVNSISDAFIGASSTKREEANVSLLERALERMNGSKKINDCTLKKSTATVLNTQIVILSESTEGLRKRNNARSLAQSFDTISADNSLIAKPHRKSFNFTDLSIGAEINKIGDEECQNFIALPGRDVLEKYDCIDRIETKETSVPEDLQKGTLGIGVNTFRGHEQPAYLSTDTEFKQLTLVLIGPTRAGKTTLMGNLSNDALKAGECVVIFDYIGKCELSTEISALFPPEQVLNIECGDFKKIQGIGYNEVGFSEDTDTQYDNAKKQTTQLCTLVNSINTDDSNLSARMDRYLQCASLVVFITGGPIRDVFAVLQDHNIRRSYVDRVPKEQYENMEEYLKSLSELNEFSKDGQQIIGTKTHLISGIIDRLNKLKNNTFMEKMLKKDTSENIDLVDELQKNQLICLKMPEVMFSTDGERDVYTTYWITKLWLALQIRKAKLANRKDLTKVNLIVDELYQVENTQKFLTDKISRLAKFGLKPIISCHYLNQIKYIREELRSANASYMLISGCDKKNFTELSSELYPFEEEDLLKLPRYHSMNLVKNKDGYARFITKLPKPISSN